MSYTFRLATQKQTPLLKALTTLLQQTPPIATSTDYTSLLGNILLLAKQYPYPKTQGTLFAPELTEAKKLYPLSESTPWGGVVLKTVDVKNDVIQKLLVIKQYGILGFELHKKKTEKLHVLEGVCLLLSSRHTDTQWKKGLVTITLGTIGEKITLNPGDEHGIIALSNCIIQETSTNHLTDLTYIFQSQ